MNIDINQYDLRELFRFDLLKNILLNITTEQKKLSEEINEIKKLNKNRDDKINNLEKSITFKLERLESDLNQNKFDSYLIDEKKDSQENKGNVDDDKIKTNNIKDIDKESLNKEFNNITNYNQESSNKITNNSSEGKMNVRNSIFNIDNKNKIPKEIVVFFMKGAHSLEEKINNLGNKLTNYFENQIKKVENNSMENIEEIKSAYQKFDEQLNDLLSDKEEQNRKIENCLLKCDSIDIFNLLKDSGDGKVDAAKLMVTTLEEKIFKKFQFVDERHKKDAEDIINLLKANEKNKLQIEKLQKNVTDIKYNDLVQMNEYFKNTLKENDNKLSNILKEFDDKEIDLSQKLSELENNLAGIINEKEETISKKDEIIIKFQNNLVNIQEKLNKSNKKQDAFNKELVNDIERKISFLKGQITPIETNLKIFTNSFDPEKIIGDIAEIKSNLEDKITKDHLNELYTFNYNHNEEIRNNKKLIKATQEQIKKCESDIKSINPKVDSFINYIISERTKMKEKKKEVIDWKQFVVIEKFEENMKYFTRRIESIFMELESLKRNLDDVKLEQKSFETKEMIIKIEDEIHNQIDDNKSKMQKNKNELNKQIKGLEVEIKSIWDELKKQENVGNWILAKQPMKCFNCATCDNDIKIESHKEKEEHVNWNKILPSSRSYRIGKGFSHILDKISKEFINDLEKLGENNKSEILNKERNIKNNLNHINSRSQGDENKSNNNDKNNNSNLDSIAQIERCSSQPKMAIKSGRNKKSNNNEKMLLPQVVDLARKKAFLDSFKNINSASDKEKSILNDYTLRNLIRLYSPKIIKIKKKNNPQSVSFVQPSIKDKL